MRTQACKRFDAICSCQQTEAKLLDTAQLSEHFFSLVLYAIITRNTDSKEGPVGLGPNVARLVCDPSLEFQMQYKVRCDGTITVGDDFNGNVAKYNFTCMPLIFGLIESWKRTHPESRYIGALDELVKASIGDTNMTITTALLEMYALATRTCHEAGVRHWPHTDEHQALMRDTGMLN
jgi:hypothetical protein